MTVPSPEAGFYLWPETPIDDETFAKQLLERAAVKSYPVVTSPETRRWGIPAKTGSVWPWSLNWLIV